MTDERMEELLGAWMRSSAAPEPDACRSAASVLERLDDGSGRATRSQRLGPYLQAVASLAVVAVIGGLLLLAVGGPEAAPTDRRPAVVGASSSPAPTDTTVPASPPIHWRSDGADLRADSLTLRIGDEVYTGAGADFKIESQIDEESWVLASSWREQGLDLELRTQLEASEDRWWVGFQLVLPDVIAPDGSRYPGLVRLGNPSDRPGALPLGEPWVTDWSEASTLERPACGGFGFETLDVSLELDGLYLEIHPPEASAIDRLGLDVTDPIQLDCPPEETVERRVGDLTLVGVPVAEGLLRLTGDAFNDYDQPMRDVAVDDRGRVLVATATGVLELGSDARRIDTSDLMKHLARIDLASDGTMIIRGGKRKVEKNLVAVREDGGWRALPDYQIGTPGGAPPRDLNDPVIAADGSLYAGVPGGLGRFDGRTWSLVSRQRTSPIATATYVGPFGQTKGLVVTDDGTLWVGVGHTLSEHRDGAWIEHEPLAGYIDELFDGLPGDPLFESDLMDLGMGRDGTLWAVARIIAEGANRGGIALVRRDTAGWMVFPLDEIAPGWAPDAWNVLVDDGGAVLLLLAEGPLNGVPRPDGARLVRFDGETATELARLPSDLGFRLTDVGPHGTVWLIGGYPKERPFDRVHVVTPPTETAVE